MESGIGSTMRKKPSIVSIIREINSQNQWAEMDLKRD
jgi:hypothetical protein